MYCLHCDRFVETKFIRPGSSGVSYVLAGIAVGCALPALTTHSTGALTILAVIFGVAWGVYVAWRRPRRYQVCASCGSPYIVEHLMPTLRRAA